MRETWARPGVPGVREIAALAAVTIAYVASAELGFTLASGTKQVTAVWPPTGIAVAALLICGHRIWPAIWLGAFVSNALSHEPLYTAAAIALGNTLGPIVGVTLLRRLFDFENALERLRDVVGLVIVASALGMTITATNGVIQLALAGIVPWHAYGSVWTVWWAGDATGVLLVAPLILTWAKRPQHKREGAIVEFVALILGVSVVTWLTFASGFPAAYPLYPFMIWSALRFRQRETTLVIALTCVLAIWGTMHGRGPFSHGSLDQTLVLLMLFIGVLAITGLVLGAVIAERLAANSRLEAAEQRFRVLAQTVPQMVWIADPSGRVDWYNDRWYEYTGQTSDGARGWGRERAHHPDDLARVIADWPAWIAAGERFEREFRIRRHDGAFRWFLTRVEPLRDKNGSIIRWYGTDTDVDDQRRALERTTRVAETLRAAFLPKQLPQHPGLRLDALYLAAEREALVGGDWYDAFELPGGAIVISIGDVVGHGFGAAVTAARIRQAISTSAFDTVDPGGILARVNRVLQFQDSAIATALVAVIDADLESMQYASAGHPTPIHAGPSVAARILPYGGVPLGVSASIDLKVQRVPLERDDVVLFYTDGLTEFKRDLESTEARLLEVVGDFAGDTTTSRPAAAIQREVMGTAKPADDTVLLVLQRSSATISSDLDQVDLRKSFAFHSSDAYSAHHSRTELMRFFRRFALSDEDLFRAELVIGEILANTVEHAPGLVTVEVDWTGFSPVLTIVDEGPGLTRLACSLPADRLSEHGRGLFLISTLSIEAQVEATPGYGTKMHVRLPISRAEAPQRAEHIGDPLG